MSQDARAKSILFICTGNIFRSVAAEYALKAALGSQSGYVVGSAGIRAAPEIIHPLIRDYLQIKGADPSRHVQRRLTRELLESAALPLAMGLNHRDFIRKHFERDVLLFNEACYEKPEPVLDVHEAIPDWETNWEAAMVYTRSVIDHIWNAIPALLERMPKLVSP